MKTRKNIKRKGGTGTRIKLDRPGLRLDSSSQTRKLQSLSSKANSAPTPKKVSKIPDAKKLMNRLSKFNTTRKRSILKVDKILDNVAPSDPPRRFVSTPITQSSSTHKIKPEHVIVLNDADDIDELKDEINRLNDFNEKLVHEIYNLTEKLKALENVTGQVEHCPASSSQKVEEFEVNKNEELEQTLQALKKRVLNDIMEQINKNKSIKEKIKHELYVLRSKKEFSSSSGQITSALQKKAAEKLPRWIHTFVASKIGQKVALACSKTDSYLSDKEIAAVVEFAIRELEKK